MSFFQKLSELIEGYTLQLTIKKEEDKLIVMLVPKLNAKKDDTQKEIVPLSFVGTLQQLDVQFLLTIATGPRKATELQNNVAQFEKSLEKADKKVTAKADDKKPVKAKDEGLSAKKEGEDVPDNEEEDETDGDGTSNAEHGIDNSPFDADPPKDAPKQIPKPKAAAAAMPKPISVVTPAKEPLPVQKNDEFGDEEW